MAQYLVRLQQAPQLRPASEQFGLAALCLRCVLDQLLGRLAPLVAAAAAVGSPGAQPPLQLHAAAATAAADPRFVELCCPMLEQARRVLQVRGYCQYRV